MIPTWYIEWAANHALKFNFNLEGQRTILSWAAEFSSIYTTEELSEATRVLFEDPQTPRFANEQRGLIINAVVADRVYRQRRREAERSAEYTCERRCHRGFLIVPHPGLDGNGRWYGFLRTPAEDPKGNSRTCAVACDCSYGQGITKHRTIADYQREFYNWREIDELRKEALENRDRPKQPTEADVQALVAEIADRSNSERMSLPRTPRLN